MDGEQAIESGGATATAAPPILEARNLTKAFGRTVAVRDLTFEVEAGSITGVIGPNGAGKSTTFLMLATLLQPTSGIARVCGHDPVGDPMEVRRRIGYMPDFFGIYDDLRVDEYLDFFAASYGVPPARRPQLVTDLLELVDLSGKRDAFVNTLSRGMKQRLCLARAMVHDPSLLILDEPASGLDPRARVELRALLLELQKMGKTILISSHILSELEEVCSHVVILEAGRVVAQGSTAEIGRRIHRARRIRIRTAGEASERVLALLAEREEVTSAKANGVVVDIEVAGGDDEAAALLAALVAAGVPVIEFTEVSAGLEEIFMTVTKGVVQ